MMQDNKKIIWISIFIALLSTIFISNKSTTFGAPFQWVTFYGKNDINNFFSLFTSKNFTQTNFNIGILAINILLNYLVLFFVHKKFKLNVSKRKEK